MPSLREVRVCKLLTIRKLAARADVATRTITQIEAGRTVPHFETMQRLADALDVEPTEIDEFRAAIERMLGRRLRDGAQGGGERLAVSTAERSRTQERDD